MRSNYRKAYQAIQLPFKINKPVLALGSQTKNTVCFAAGRTAYISPVHADLSVPRDLDGFEKDVKYFLNKKPSIIAHDLHPEYQSTKYALTLQPRPLTLRPVQHHHAHIASCMAENGLKNQQVIGVAFDGTGLGSDGTLRGAEFLIITNKDFERAGQLKPIPLLGREAAIREPWRVAAAWLDEAYGEKFSGLGIGFTKKMDKKKWAVLKKMHRAGLNSLPASSMGRLFDAAASILLEDQLVHKEAELAIKLEKLAGRDRAQDKAYNFEIVRKAGGYIIEPASTFKGMVTDIKKHAPEKKIAYRFHLSAAMMIKKMCLKIRQSRRINQVVFSGGVFQNNLLLYLGRGLLYEQGFVVLTHKRLSCNDSGISLGQAVIAAYQ